MTTLKKTAAVQRKLMHWERGWDLDLKSILERQILLLLSSLGNFCLCWGVGRVQWPLPLQGSAAVLLLFGTFRRGFAVPRPFPGAPSSAEEASPLFPAVYCSHPGSASQLCTGISLWSGRALCGISVPFTMARVWVGTQSFPSSSFWRESPAGDLHLVTSKSPVWSWRPKLLQKLKMRWT